MKWIWATCLLLQAGLTPPEPTVLVGEQIRQSAPANAMVWVHTGKQHPMQPIPAVFVADHQLILGSWNWPSLSATDTLWLCDEEGSMRIALPVAQMDIFPFAEAKHKKIFFRMLRLKDTKPVWAYAHSILEIGNPGKPKPTDRAWPQWWAFQPADSLWVAQVAESDSLMPPAAVHSAPLARGSWGLQLVKRKSKWWMVQWWRNTPSGKREWNTFNPDFISWISEHM